MEPPAKKARIDFTKTITIRSDWEDSPDTQRFQIPEDLIIPRSIRALRAQKKGREVQIYESPETCSTYLQLLYTGKVVVTEFEDQDRLQGTKDQIWDRILSLFSVSVWMEDAESTNQTIDKICWMLQSHGLTEKALARACDEDGYGLLGIFVDHIASNEKAGGEVVKYLNPGGLLNLSEACMRVEILSGVMEELMKRRDRSGIAEHWLELGTERFHVQPWTCKEPEKQESEEQESEKQESEKEDEDDEELT